MQIGVVLPAAEAGASGVTPPWAMVRSFAESAERHGLDSVWMIDHFFTATPDGRREGMHEVWTTIGAVAAVTARIQVGTLVVCSPFRNPALTAKAAATVAEISAGRLVLGLGAGWHDPEFAAFGYPLDHRVGRFAEALPIVAALLRGTTVSVDGRFHRMREAELVPPPPHPVPVLVAAEGPRMLGLAAAYADAWITAWYGHPDARLHAQLAAMDAVAAPAGRDRVQRFVGINVHDPDGGVPPDPDESVILGSVRELAAALDAYAALGIDHVVVQLTPHDERSLVRLAAAVGRAACSRGRRPQT
ncbi:LLM class flavin-dependent oxidoreductase [Pseudonocardia sp. GCM10023141]|uniref:LLM class flavin-dependent oxidoreductase n=1 Tax=Pseudonocardia sp. GCM10023141 TaxID=3252653 RepID=UPI00360A0E74